MINYQTTATTVGPRTLQRTYAIKNTHPGMLPSATIHMNGLLCFSFDNANKCTIGVNNTVSNEHKWKFTIADLEPGKLGNKQTWKEGDFPDLSEIYINVQGGSMHGTYVYTGDPVSIPNNDYYRYNLESHWLDLEGERGHNKRIKNNTNTLWPRFYINEGLFCASRLSRQPYVLKDSNPQPRLKPLGQIAVRSVADIFLDTNNPNSKIQVRLPRQIVNLDNKRRYNIFLSNSCGSTTHDDIDFHLHYNAFSQAFDGPNEMKTLDQFHLVRESGSRVPRYSDKAPCMGIALGQTSAFN